MLQLAHYGLKAESRHDILLPLPQLNPVKRLIPILWDSWLSGYEVLDTKKKKWFL